MFIPTNRFRAIESYFETVCHLNQQLHKHIYGNKSNTELKYGVQFN